MKTNTKKLFLNSFSKIKLISDDFNHVFDYDRYSSEMHSVDYEDNNFVILVTFEEEVKWDRDGSYEFEDLHIGSLKIYDKEGEELFIDVTDEELLNALNY